MKLMIVAFLGLACSGAANAQLVGDRVDGGTRICTYNVQPGLLSTEQTRQERSIDLGRACPPTMPPRSSDEALPNTAQLYSWTTDGAQKVCVYAQGQRSWTRSLPISATCPNTSGLLPPEARR